MYNSIFAKRTIGYSEPSGNSDKSETLGYFLVTANLTYFVAVLSVERNQVWGFAETTFDTLPMLEEEDEFDTEEFPVGGK